MPRRTQPGRNKKLRKETSEGGRTKLLPSSGWRELSGRGGGHAGKLDLPGRERALPQPSLQGGGRKGPAGAGAGKLGIWPGLWDPQEGSSHPHHSPVPCTHLNLAHQGALSCQCWAGDTRCWALTEAPCHPQGSANRRRVSQHILRWLDWGPHRVEYPEDRAMSLLQGGAHQHRDCLPHQSGTLEGRSYMSPMRLFGAFPNTLMEPRRLELLPQLSCASSLRLDLPEPRVLHTTLGSEDHLCSWTQFPQGKAHIYPLRRGAHEGEDRVSHQIGGACCPLHTPAMRPTSDQTPPTSPLPHLPALPCPRHR